MIFHVPCVVLAAVGLRVYLESSFKSNSKVVSRTSKSPEQVRICFLGDFEYFSTCNQQLARDHVVVQVAIFALKSAKSSAEADAHQPYSWAGADSYKVVSYKNDHRLLVDKTY